MVNYWGSVSDTVFFSLLGLDFHNRKPPACGVKTSLKLPERQDFIGIFCVNDIQTIGAFCVCDDAENVLFINKNANRINEIDISNFPVGMYEVVVVSNGVTITENFVKQ